MGRPVAGERAVTWSFVATSNGTSSATSFSPTWPAGVQDGDVVVWCPAINPDATPTCTTPGWNLSDGGARFMWSRYSAAQALPVIGNATAAAITWRMAAFRSTVGSAFGVNTNADGTPPATFAITTTTPNTLLVLFGVVIGDQAVGWTIDGPFTTAHSEHAGGSGNPNGVNLYIGWQSVASPTALTGLRAHIIANRHFLLAVGEPQAGNLGFFL